MESLLQCNGAELNIDMLQKVVNTGLSSDIGPAKAEGVMIKPANETPLNRPRHIIKIRVQLPQTMQRPPYTITDLIMSAVSKNGWPENMDPELVSGIIKECLDDIEVDR